jgi:hypothetical protein
VGLLSVGLDNRDGAVGSLLDLCSAWDQQTSGGMYQHGGLRQGDARDLEEALLGPGARGGLLGGGQVLVRVRGTVPVSVTIH